MICDFTYNVCICWCVWVKKEYVQSALKRHLNRQFFYFFGKFLFYTPCLLNNSFPLCLLEKLWGLYRSCAATLCTFHTDATRSV